MTLTERDQELLQALVCKVRLFALRQLASHWWFSDVANARRGLKRLNAVGLIERIGVRSRSLPKLAEPVSVWQPGHQEPDHAAVANTLQQRWKGRAVREAAACVATDQAAHLFGGRRRGALKNPLQATHDLGVAAVWLRLHAEAPEWANAWQGEDLMAHTRIGQKLPDAFIVDGEGHTVSVIEFGGSYDTQRVTEFHRDCDDRGLPYQLW